MKTMVMLFVEGDALMWWQHDTSTEIQEIIKTVFTLFFHIYICVSSLLDKQKTNDFDSDTL